MTTPDLRVITNPKHPDEQRKMARLREVLRTAWIEQQILLARASAAH